MLLLSLAVAMGGGCVKRVEKSDKALEHEKWIASLDDSVAALGREAELARTRLDESTVLTSQLLEKFEYVNNPREVEGYTILRGWRARYPLSSTGLVARIMENEGLELVAALSGGVFSRIRVSAGGESVESESVPYDQALNYRAQGLNTVAFTGGKADSVAAFVSEHLGEKIELAFLESGVSGRMILPEANCNMIAETWKLYSTRQEVGRLEKQLPLINARISALRRLKDSRSGK